jgi:predicted amidophosphoribosyltransferase
MSTITCPQCKARIPGTSTTCPKCNAPIDARLAEKRAETGRNPHSAKLGGLVAVILIVLAAIVAFYFFS